MSVNKKRKLFGGQKTLADIGFKVNKVTDADVSDKEQGNENEIGSDELKEKVTRRFQEKWLSLYKWLKYDDNAMFCKVCIDRNRQNTFTTGSTNFRTSSLNEHMKVLIIKLPL
jgi:hypothetical protein